MVFVADLLRGEVADVDRCQPVLRAMGDPERIFHVGVRGTGYAVKLCLNLLWFIHVAAAADDWVTKETAAVADAQATLNATPVTEADARQTASWWDGQPFDAILLDAPCSASGIVRRHPDVRWLRRPGDISQLAAIQRQLLATLWPQLKPGGRLLYCTCSVFREEGQFAVETFLAHNTDAALLPSPGHLIPGKPAKQDAVPDNQRGDHDGFFYALLQKQAD